VLLTINADVPAIIYHKKLQAVRKHSTEIMYFLLQPVIIFVNTDVFRGRFFYSLNAN
jgi:hypothetical protein